MYVHVIKKKKKITADFILYVLKLYITVYVKTKKLKNPVLFTKLLPMFYIHFCKRKTSRPKDWNNGSRLPRSQDSDNNI